MSKDIPSFVTWNWPLIRKCTFFLFLSGIFAMCSIVVAMIVNLPKTCNPETTWYQGSVFYEIFPASFKDSEGKNFELFHTNLNLTQKSLSGDGIGDLRGLASQVSYFQNLSIGAIRLNSIFSAKHYPDNFREIDNLMEISKELGTMEDLENLVRVLHDKNISLILDLPLYPKFMSLEPSTMENLTRDAQENELNRIERSLMETNKITNVIRFWLSKGIDGFYMKGLENFAEDQYLGENLREWKYVLGKDRVMIVNQSLISSVSDELLEEIFQVVDLVDVFLDISNGTQMIEHQVIDVMNGQLKPSARGPWIHWSINCVDRSGRVSTGISPNASLAAVLMEIMLPGTPSIFYGDEISMEQSHDPSREHDETKHLHHLPTMSFKDQSSFTNHKTLPWLPRSASVSYQHLQYVTDAIAMRKVTPPLYKNSVNKDGNEAHGNTHIRANKNDLLIIERTYPRRNTYVSITNLGSENLTVDISAFYYSGELVLGPAKRSKVFFSNFKIRALETVIIRLDK
jgi:glycosidase